MTTTQPNPTVRPKTVKRSNLSIAQQLAAASLLITNSRTNPTIQAMVASFGYPAEGLEEGQRLYEAAVAAGERLAAALGDQKHATARARQAERAARTSHQTLAQIVRAVLPPKSPYLTTLKLRGTTPRNTAEFLIAAMTLFTNALATPAILALLAKYSYDQAKIQREYAVIMAFAAARQAQVAAVGVTRRLTRERNTAMELLHDWTTQYVRIARVALASAPDLLRELGIAVRVDQPIVADRTITPPAAASSSE